MRHLLLAFKIIVALVTLLALSVILFVNYAPTFGASPRGESLERIESSEHYQDGRFKNKIETVLDTSTPEQPRSLGAFFSPAADKNPTAPLPTKSLQAKTLSPGQFIWLGHSTVLFNADNTIILTDPVFHRASPVPFIGEPFEMQFTPALDQLPAIDVVLISHDHYDHLDHLAIQALNQKVEHFLVPLGLASHLMHWGIPTSKISEFDWYESVQLQGVDFTLTPARHFSGRGINNRFSTLWGSWVVASKTLKVFFSGDSGYFDEFKQIGQNFGPFDIAFIENGAYNATWAQVHMLPEQAVQTSLDLGANYFFPIHWGKFDLALHPWDEPIQRAKTAAEQQAVQMLTPLIGETFSLQTPPQSDWWLNTKQ